MADLHTDRSPSKTDHDSPPAKRQRLSASASTPAKAELTFAESVFRFQSRTPPRFHQKTPLKPRSQSVATKPCPFTFHTTERAEVNKRFSMEKQTPGYVPLSVQVQKFSQDTPPRFKRTPLPPATRQPTTLTRPNPFRLRVDERADTRKPVSMPPPPPKEFKANPLSKKVLKSVGEVGIPRVEKRPSTIPIGFKFLTRTESKAFPR